MSLVFKYLGTPSQKKLSLFDKFLITLEFFYQTINYNFSDYGLHHKRFPKNFLKVFEKR